MAGGTARIHIEAPPERVYELVSDVTRMAAWSPETYRAEWRGGATAPAPGARFRGWNRMGPVRWFTDPVVDEAVPGEVFSFTTTMFGRGRFTTWTYRMHAAPAGGTELEESWEAVGHFTPLGRALLTPRREEALQRGMEETLQRIKAAAEGSEGRR